jgi:hypothetical protein
VLRRIFGTKGRREQKGGKKCMMRGFITYRSDQIKENEKGLECSTHGSNEKCIQNTGVRRRFRRARCRLEGVLEWILKRKDGWCQLD